MKIKIFLTACATALLITPSTFATSSNETAGQEKTLAPAHAPAAPAQMGTTTRMLPDDTRPVETAPSPTTTTKTATTKAVTTTATRKTDNTPATTKASIRQERKAARQAAHGPHDAPMRGNGFAVASMVLGILAITVGWAFVPVGLAMALLAVIFGGIGLAPGRRGKGMAIVGLALGLLTMLITGLFIAFLVAIFI